MPCYEMRTLSVEFKAQNRQLLDKAIAALKMRADVRGNKISLDYGNIVLDLEAGKAVVSEYSQSKLNALKRQYTLEAITSAAKTNQWMVKTPGKLQGQIVKF